MGLLYDFRQNFKKTTDFVNQKYFRTMGINIQCRIHRVQPWSDAFKMLSWSTCCVLVFITLRLVQTQQAMESIALSCPLAQHGMFRFFMRCSLCTHNAMPYNYESSHCHAAYAHIFEVKNSLAWCKKVAHRL